MKYITAIREIILKMLEEYLSDKERNEREKC